MHAATAEELQSFVPTRSLLVCVDSDGCVFNTMTLKHQECFCPAFINRFGLQAVSSLARETWEFVNLFSRSRGMNRFLALLRSLDLLRSRPEVKRTGVEVPRLRGLEEWVARGQKLSNAALETAYRSSGDPDLGRALEWSKEVNEAVERIARGGVAPFSSVPAALSALAEKADIVIVSQTPAEAICREWVEQGLGAWPRLVAGQEAGSKSDCVRLASARRYDRDRVLVLGDAVGDLEAARENGVRFYPILPGGEEASWSFFLGEALERFTSGAYAGAFEDGLVGRFEEALPERVPWAEG